VDLHSSVRNVLVDVGIRASTRRAGTALVVLGPEPVSVAAALGDMPGVSWVAVGVSGHSSRDLSDSAKILSGIYVHPRERFAVKAEGPSRAVASDLEGRITSSILESIRGSRVSVESPRVVFRVAFDGKAGAVGVELKPGPGGVPTGNDEAACLVSGGMHSSVLAWLAVIAGFRVRLVHAESGDESLRAVAELYSELSHRADPRGLNLEVLGGDTVALNTSGATG
jgi:adenylyl- and sulfurtransferase ThiI